MGDPEKARRLALLIEYDGTDFSGWQVQPGERTVQGELEQAFVQLGGVRCAVTGAGRTDAGVHASGMVAHVDLPEDFGITNEKLVAALNALTGYDLVVKQVRTVPSDFHARFTAEARQYRYTIVRERTALQRDFTWQVLYDLDTDRIVQATNLLIGEHDFTSFSKQTEDVSHFRCTVSKAFWKSDGTAFVLTLRANRFVRGMVRALVGALVHVGRGELTLEEFNSLLITPSEPGRAKFLAPASGLVLTGVQYPEHFGLWTID